MLTREAKTTETEKSVTEIAEQITGDVAKICGCAWSSCTRTRTATTKAIEKALRDRDERAAKICEGLVTFSPEHEKYTPADGAPCGWCDGLETAASAIRGKS